MTDAVGDSDAAAEDRDGFDGVERLAARGLQAGLAAILAYGVLTVSFGVVVNAGVALGITLLPALLRRDLVVPPDPGLLLWVTAAVFVHAVGALGVYRAFAWYDQLAHVLSASVVAAVGYATVRTLERHDEDVSFPDAFFVIVVVVMTMALGVAWELVEFGVSGLASMLGSKSVLVVYGVDDIALDLVFNGVGGVVVGVLGAGPFSDVARRLGRRMFGRASDR